MIGTVAIVGTGLIGASFGLALKKAGFRGTVLGVSSPRAASEALACGAIDRAMPLEEAARAADLVYLSQTISRILDTIPKLASIVKPGALITDAGSTKVRIVSLAACLGDGVQFLGAHPMAGKEKRGAAAADADLFAGRTYILTPCAQEELETPAAREFVEWVRRIGAVPVVLNPEEHDRVVALTSHLPQLLSTGLAATLAARLNKPEYLRAGGPGLADMTRLAGSAWEIWADILATNIGPVDAALADCIETLERMRQDLTGETTRGLFDSASGFSAKLRR